MIELFETAILLCVLPFAWKLFKEAARDYIRDRMFALRDAWREFHESNGLDFSTSHYVSTRKIINGYIRGVGKIRLSSYFYFKKNLKHDIREYLQEKYSRNPKHGATVKAIKMAESIEEKLYLLTMFYMFTTTIWFLPFFIATFIFMLVKNLMVDPLNKVVRESVTAFANAARSFIPDRELVWMSSLI